MVLLEFGIQEKVVTQLLYLMFRNLIMILLHISNGKKLKLEMIVLLSLLMDLLIFGILESLKKIDLKVLQLKI